LIFFKAAFCFLYICIKINLGVPTKKGGRAFGSRFLKFSAKALILKELQQMPQSLTQTKVKL